MGANQCFTLLEATLALYPSTPDGSAALGAPIWIGACAEGLTLRPRLESHRVAATGTRFARNYHVDEEHQIEIERLWVLPRPGLEDYRPVRNQNHILTIRWEDGSRWHQRTYRGVTAQGWEMASRGVMQFLQNQTFLAQTYDSAPNAGAPPLDPVPSLPLETHAPFFHDGPVPVGDYCTGHYAWETPVTLNHLAIVGLAPQGTGATFTLELGGVPTATTITLPAGAVNTETSATAAPSVLIPAGQTARWRCTAGPASIQDAPWEVSLTMRVS